MFQAAAAASLPSQLIVHLLLCPRLSFQDNECSADVAERSRMSGTSRLRWLSEVGVWVAIPVGVGALLLHPPWWEPPAGLPYWSQLALSEYPATAVTLAVLVVYAALRLRRRTPVQEMWLPTYFLPVYVAGIESAWALANTMALDCLSAECMEFQAVNGARAVACVLGATVIVGAGAAQLCRRSASWRVPVHPVVVAILASAALSWGAYLYLVHRFR